MNEKIKERTRKVKAHFQRNKKTYLACGGTAVVAVLGTLVITQRTRVDISAQKMSGAVLYKPTQTIDVHVEALGDPGNIIQDTTTGIVYASQGQAARELGLEPGRISEQLSGKRDTVNGHTFVKLGKAMVAE